LSNLPRTSVLGYSQPSLWDSYVNGVLPLAVVLGRLVIKRATLIYSFTRPR
jgi:hypothetical protein